MRNKVSIICLSALFVFVFGSEQTSAISFTPPAFNDTRYLGSYVSQTVADPIAIEAGKTKEVIVKIKNVGTATWNNTGNNYVSLYTVNPNYRASAFANSTWIDKDQPAKISETTAPGETAEIKISLTAPSKAGDYTEDFYLAAENVTWIKSSYFYFKIKVTAASGSVTNTASVAAGNYTFTRNLEVGMSGADVKELQKFLNNNGFVIALSGVGSPGNETTLFGSLTKSALIKFQKAKGISPTSGYFGSVTRGVVNKIISSANTTAAVPSGDTGESGNSTQGVNDQAEEVSKEYQANLVAFSSRQITARGGDLINFKVRYRNDGTVAWNNYLWQEAGSIRKGTEAERVILSDQSWMSDKKIFEKAELISPGGIAEISYVFRAPVSQGEYTARFQLTANGHTLDGGTLELPVSVTADAPVGYMPPVFSSITTRGLIIEPKIRVGLYKVTAPVKFQAPFNYDIWAGEILKGTLPANELAEIKYFDGLYTFTAQSLSFTGRDLVRFVPQDSNSYFVLTNYDRYVSWKGSKNFNAYRGTMEFKYSNNSAAPWVVNELPLDLYIAGIAETSNGAAMEYIKALLVAARSYAYYHMNNGTPADQRTFDVVATTADQLYLGYNSEVLMPRVVQAARATYGEMVTYNGTPVVTPYFGHSDGKTHTWKEVWGGLDKAWLVPVVCKYDIGETMWGHGVGMSAQDAAYRADKDAWTYDQLLKYYYTGVQVERIF